MFNGFVSKLLNVESPPKAKGAGLPDFSWCNIPKWQITTKYTKW
jgi:hypothetical protein